MIQKKSQLGILNILSSFDAQGLIQMNLPYSDQLNIAALSRLFDNKSECYKLFWFKAIIRYVSDGQQDLIFEDLIDEMIADAWYMVTEYHLNLGPRDTLEKAVDYIAFVSNMASSVKKDVVLAWLKSSQDPLVLKYKRDITLNVPYRLQAPFFEGFTTQTWNCGSKVLAENINQQKRLMYYFTLISGLQTRIHITDEWADYLTRNREILRGWIHFNMITYLQRRNPSVPGISDKLYPPQERKLEKVKKYWKLLLSTEEFRDIYGKIILTTEDISIDHFVPWSYVAHDELWNLHPTTRAINSSKSNNLPDWDQYFPLLMATEFHAYRMMWKYDSVQTEFKKCAREHLNNSEIEYRLYKEGQSQDAFGRQLEDILHPVYLSAKTCGFKNWVYTGE